MALQGVPLFIANDSAEHGGPVSRALTYAAYRGIEGVLGSTDFRVQETATPGGSVDVLPGVYNALARGPSQDLQSYSGSALTSTNFTIPANNTSTMRSDLIYLSVEDPNDGTGQWATPADAVNGPYEFIRREEGVGTSVTSIHELSGSIGTRNAADLARIDIPANTGTITNADITDLRRLASPLSETDQAALAGPATTESATGTTFVDLPSTGNTSIYVPPWATKMVLDVTNKNMRVHDTTAGTDNQMFGRSAVTINGGGRVITSYWNTTFSGPYDDVWTGVAGDIDVTAYQNQTITLQAVHNVDGGTDQPNQQIEAFDATSTIFKWTFKQELEKV